MVCFQRNNVKEIEVHIVRVETQVNKIKNITTILENTWGFSRKNIYIRKHRRVFLSDRFQQCPTIL